MVTACSMAGDNSSKDNGSSDSTTASSNAKFTLACWNAQTFFDAEVDGTEYADYKNLSKWSREKYMARLGRLCQVMTTLNPDVMVLEEIENAAVVQDIANQLMGNTWSKKNNWSYATFAKNEGAAIGCAIFSKFPLTGAKVHVLDIRTQVESQPESRPMLQVSIDVDGRQVEVFVNHWKSKSGGKEETEIWRDWQELVCEREVAKVCGGSCSWACVVCGDFNRDAVDFVYEAGSSAGGKKGNILFRGMDGTFRLFSPWFTVSGALIGGVGSYYYQNNWERIDNIFICGNITVSNFGSRREGDWADSNGIPNSFKLFSGEGYSDHLPLMCTLTL